MSLIKKLAGETAIYGGSTILNRLLNFVIITPYLTRVFSGRQEEYGIFGLMYAFSALLLVILTYGMETAFFRFGSKADDREKAFSTACSSLLFTTLLFVVLCTGFSSQVAGLLTRPADARYVVYFAFIIGFDVLSAVPFARLRLENRPLRFAALKAMNILVNGFLLIFLLEALPRLAHGGWSPAERLYAPRRELDFVFVANLAASAVTFLVFLPAYFRLRSGFDATFWRTMFRYAWPLVIVGIAGTVNQFVDRFLLVRWLPGTLDENLRQLGIYNACIKIPVLMNLFTQAFRYASEPFFFRHAERSDSRKIYAQVGQAFTLVGSLAFLGIMLYLDIIRYLIDPSYWEGLKVVPVVLVAYLLLGLYYNISIWYKLTDRNLLGGYVAAGGAIVTLLVNFWLIPRIGYMGSAWATLLSFAFMVTVSYFLGQKYYPVPYPVARMAVYLLLALAFYGLSLPARNWWPDNQLAIFGFNTILLLTYGLIITALERKTIQALLKSR